ncbi:multiprotein bridging factor aMBF1 [Tardisphaera miroshnichenkoae]
MDFCEICGAPIRGKPYVVYIEGAKLKVCEKCAKKADSIIEKPTGSQPTRIQPTRPAAMQLSRAKAPSPSPSLRPRTKPRPRAQPPVPQDTILDENYGEIIRRAREERGMTPEQLAKKLNEKESVIRRVEEGKLRPPEPLINKLEKELEIKIRASPPPSPVSPKTSSGGITLKDVAKLRDGARAYRYSSIR